MIILIKFESLIINEKTLGVKPVFYANQFWHTTSPFFFFFFLVKTLSLKPLSLSFSSLLTWSLHLWIKPTISMAEASKLNTSHHHHCHGRSFKAQHKPLVSRPKFIAQQLFLFPSASALFSFLSHFSFCLYSLMCFCLCFQWLWSGDCGQEAQWWFSDCSREALWWCGSNLVGFVGWFGGSRWWLCSDDSWVWFGGWVGRC